MKIPIIAVCGPTASGKTSLGINIAGAFNGEVVSCDSMQIYKGLDIGTAKPTKEEMAGIVHHMIDVASPEDDFSVGEFTKMAHSAIADIHSRGKLPVLVGGTGLYMDNTVFNTVFQAPKRDEKITKELMEFAQREGVDALFEILQKEDPEQAQKLHKNDIKRVVRAIETVRTSGKSRAELDVESKAAPSLYDCLWLTVDIDREMLYERINKRVDIMLESGLVEETVREIFPKRKTLKTAMQAIGYKEIVWYLEGKCTYGESKELLKRNTRRYAKRQLTWLRRNEEINHLSLENAFFEAEALIKKKFNY